MSRFDEVLDFVLNREGRSDSEPAGDPNTSWGVTQAVYDQWRRSKKLPERNVDLGTKEEFTALYREMFWLAARCDRLPAPIDLIHFDTAVNSGVGAAGRMLQQALGMAVQDGVVGKQTIETVKAVDPIVLAGRYLRNRINNYTVIALVKPEKLGNLRGWLHRVGHLLLSL